MYEVTTFLVRMNSVKNKRIIFSKIASSATPFGLLVPVCYSLFLQILTGFPQPSYLLEIDANEVFMRFSEEIFDYPFWLQDLSHFPLFFVFSWVWLRYLGPFNFEFRKPKNLLILFICLGYAFLNEISQAFIPMRFPSIGDAVMNLLGSITGISVHAWYYSRFVTRKIVL